MKMTVRSTNRHCGELLINIALAIPFILVLATVFIVAPELENGIVSGKYFWFYLSIGLIAICGPISFFLNRRKTAFFWMDLSGLLFCGIGVLLAYKNDGPMNRIVLLTLIGLLFFYFRIFLAQYKWNIYILTVFFLFAGFVEAVWGLAQLYGFSASQHSLFKTTGSFFNSGPYAGYLAMILPGTLYFALNDYPCLKQKFNRRLLPFYLRGGIAILSLISIVLILPATMSRSSWLGAIAGCIMVAILYLKGKPHRYDKITIDKYKKRISLILPVLLILSIAALYGIYHLKKDSADGRMLMWKIAAYTIAEHPMGVGPGNFAHYYGESQAAYFKAGLGTEQEERVAGNPEYGFNEYLQIGIEFGLIPLILFLIILGGAIVSGIRHKQYPAVGMLISLSVFACMSYPFSILPFVISFVFLLALCFYEKSKNRKISGIATGMGLLVALLFVTGCIYNRYPTLEAYKNWRMVRYLHNGNHHKEAARDYKPLLPYLDHEIRFLFEYGQSLSKSEFYEESNQVLEHAAKNSCDPMLYNIMGKNHQALKNYEEAEQCLKTSAGIVPSRLYPYYLLTQLYDEMGDIGQTRRMAAIVKMKEPKVQSQAVREMREEVEKIIEKHKNETD